MKIRDISFKMFVDNGIFKRAEIIESILDGMMHEDEEIEIRVTDVPNLVYDDYDYYLLSFQTLARSKQEYLVEQSYENVYGMFLVCESKSTHQRGLVYITDTSSEVVLGVMYDSIGKIGNKIFQGFDKNGMCVAQVYDNSYDFVDFTEMYMHDILNFAGFRFYLMNGSESELENSDFLYVEVSGIDESSNDFTDEVEDIFILRSREEFDTFFTELMQELGELYTSQEYEELLDIKNDLCTYLRF